MAITDINISETLETNAPSIKYRGNEGPKSPQEEQMIMEQQQMAAVDPLMQKKIKLIEELMSQGYDFGAASNLADKIMAGQDEQDIGMAYGGIAGLDGRVRYGIGSSLKKRLRKLIPNEVADIAVKAAPFVAPFNPIAAGLMSGIGGFDRHGSISKGLKSGLMNYGMGQLARGIGGADLQKGFNLKINPNATGLGQYFSSPIATAATTTTSPMVEKGALTESGQAFGAAQDLGADRFSDEMVFKDLVTTGGKETADKTFLGSLKNKVMEYVPTSFADLKDPKKLIGAIGITTAATKLLGQGPEETVDIIMDRGEDLDLDSIRLEVREAFKDPSGEKLAALRNKYPYLGTQASKNIDAMAQGGRAGFAEGGGIMDLGGMEKDYRNTGGFVDIGAKEKLDDVPARLSVNEFVMTADAVRGAGGGDIDKGAEIMENVMENLENGGRISEESQGLKGAQEMFEVSERLSEVV